MAKVLEKFFAEIHADVLEAFDAQARGDVPSADVIAGAVFQPKERLDDLKAIAGPEKEKWMLFAARQLWARHREQRAVTVEPKAKIPDKLPERMVDAIREFLRVEMAQDHWRGVLDTMRHDLARTLGEGIEEGEGWPDLRDRVDEALGFTRSQDRALLVARTETNGSMNAGHQATRAYFSDKGVSVKKEWLAIPDDRVRADHAAAEGQQVANDENVVIGGEETPYPGWYGLSPEQRCNCRCTVVTNFEGEAEGEDSGD